jgi:hypothetical protein
LCAEFDSLRQLFTIRLAIKERRFVLSLAPRLAEVTGAACNSVSMPHFTDVFNEKF